MVASSFPPGQSFSAIYGPVKSWRYGRSLGIDPIGIISTCSFNCVYCQLGNIQQRTSERQIFVPTEQIICELQAIPTAGYLDIDVVTFSGSGEPTLALNLGEMLAIAKKITNRAIVVLTNSSKLDDPAVRQALTTADIVAVKLDAISSNQLRHINQPTETIDLPQILAGIEQFRREYSGILAIQTMVLANWTADIQNNYIRFLERIKPDEIQFNTPSRPRILTRTLESRGNEHSENRSSSYQYFKCITADKLTALAEKINNLTKIPVRYASRT
ncbi:hypothetical protein B6N60_03264 [Richelia sinica FACHB-800]|uniref:Radical SAM core domain-containing protein n=1 Tax=Richelia sinica FACHB-800 TaxID=1357546 RepID=A0A975T9G5_9NOST|nr:radical SAM protein [Richelia sinica]MBD2663381.1 radical SAM protein [Richelia sinica FACHB-800]QXE24559.1 hypothetical protein B6N60_03264 [Richelia sinica FACHB-800]